MLLCNNVLMATKGFTVVELLITISIIILVAAAPAPIYANYQVTSQLNENSSQIIQTIRIARESSAARLRNSAFGVKFLPHSYILYQGSSYATRVSDYDRDIAIEDSVTINTTLVNDEINFSKSLAVPSNAGNIILTHSVGGIRAIIVNSKGMVEEQ
jgi:Tfp pilus assembly protein FimT